MDGTVETPITRREVYDKLQETEDRIIKQVHNLGDKVDRLSARISENYVSRKEYSDLERRIEGVENLIRWGGRLIIGGVLVALMGLLITGG